MVKYRAQKKDNDSDSDEFDTSSQVGAEVNTCLEVVAGIVEEIIEGLDKEQAASSVVIDNPCSNEAAMLFQSSLEKLKLKAAELVKVQIVL